MNNFLTHIRDDIQSTLKFKRQNFKFYRNYFYLKITRNILYFSIHFSYSYHSLQVSIEKRCISTNISSVFRYKYRRIIWITTISLFRNLLKNFLTQTLKGRNIRLQGFLSLFFYFLSFHRTFKIE